MTQFVFLLTAVWTLDTMLGCCITRFVPGQEIMTSSSELRLIMPVFSVGSR